MTEIVFKVEPAPTARTQRGKWADFKRAVRALPEGQCAVIEYDSKSVANMRSNLYQRAEPGEHWHLTYSNGLMRVWVTRDQPTNGAVS